MSYKGKKSRQTPSTAPTIPPRRSARHQPKIQPGEASSSQPIPTTDLFPTIPRLPTRHQINTDQPGSSASQPIEILDSSFLALVDEYSSSPTEAPLLPLPIPSLPSPLPGKLEGLTKKGAKLLLAKQEKLQSPKSEIRSLPEIHGLQSRIPPALKEAVDATLVFAQEEAGTAVCIAREGLLLTCAHCVAETADDLDMHKIWWLIFADGQVVQARTEKWDAKRDLALLRIEAAQERPPGDEAPLTRAYFEFPRATLALAKPKTNAKLLCVGHPGSEDLETERPGVATGYDVLHISSGRFRGYAQGQDVHDNTEIGALKHDCWTYWGHSGAPLLDMASGGLVGVHSSWDDRTGMRRGVGWEALREFLEGVDLERDVFL